MALRCSWKEGAIRMNSTLLRASITSVFAGPSEQFFKPSQLQIIDVIESIAFLLDQLIKWSGIPIKPFHSDYDWTFQDRFIIGDFRKKRLKTTGSMRNPKFFEIGPIGLKQWQLDVNDIQHRCQREDVRS